MTNVNRSSALEFLAHLQPRQGKMLETLRRLVELESPSNNKQAVDRLGDFIADQFEQIGGRTTIHRQTLFGDQLQFDFPGKGEGKPIMLLGHYDTVWDVGTLATMPWRVEGERAFGPGIFDMKAGIAMMISALETLRELRGGFPRPITVLLNPDEEVGSDVSRPVTEAVARNAHAVLVLEPAQGAQGACKTARKGVGDYTIKISGKAAHAGLDFEKGVSAILELARQILRVSEFTELERGITVNVGVIRGGTRTNVIADHASADVDVRIAKVTDGPYIDQKFQSLRVVNPACTLELLGGINRPPLERNEGVAALYGVARQVAASMGFELGEVGVGGGSDGNFTAVLAPTLDGLGGVGEGAHAKNESIIVPELPRRAALVAAMMEAL